MARLENGGPETHRLSSPLLALGVGTMSSWPRLRLLARFCELALGVGASVLTLHPHAAGATPALVGIIGGGLAWLAWIAAGDRPAPVAGALLVMAIVGGVATASPQRSGLVFVGVSAAGAAFAFDLTTAVAIAGPAVVSCAVSALVQGVFPHHLWPLVAVGLLGIVSGGGRRQLLAQGRQLALVATAEQRAEVAWQETELITERNRLGRELHDVLAHTLGAVSIQLTALDSRVAAGDPPSAVRDRIAEIHGLVGDGLGEARDAVRALRGDGLPLDRQLKRLCDLHGAAFAVQGQAAQAGTELTLTLYRVAQEALTNADKHAPRTPVSVRLQCDGTAIGIRVDSGHARAAASSPLAGTGGGHGLEGMRERVTLAGGSLDAGPTDDGWRVLATVPIR